MYGVDIISVLNKAIDSNTRNNASIDNENKEYYVNIKIKIKKDIGERVEKYEKKANGEYELKSNTMKVGKSVFKANREYSLSNDENKKMFLDLLVNKMEWTDNETGETYNGKDTSISTYTSGCTSYTITYYPAAEFKRATFVCKGVEYSKKNGKVISMTFEQYK